MKARDETDIFSDLARLCVEPGYVHAIAFFCYRDNFIRYRKEVKAEDMAHMFSHSRLIRTEINTLIGLLVKQQLDFAHPGFTKLTSYVERTEALLEELHRAIARKAFESVFGGQAPVTFDVKPFGQGPMLREAIFYGGESAYSFQYLHFTGPKYQSDDPWLAKTMGFRIDDARRVADAIVRVQERKVLATHRSFESLSQEAWTMLPGFSFSAAEIAEQSDVDIDVVRHVLEAFALPVGQANAGFSALNEYNAATGTPLIRDNEGSFILFQQYSMVEALYETPFYWMNTDSAYSSTALSHRGAFTEQLALTRLTKVFGPAHVYANVDIWKSKGTKIGEIDVLVLFGNRAIVLQAKSKKLTLEARKGNDLRIKDDFKKAIQDAYDQAHLCAQALLGSSPQLTTATGHPIQLRNGMSVVYPMCIVADHYPALSVQSREFLKIQQGAGIVAPLVTDVFALDAMTEMLESPLQLLTYFDLRARFGAKITAMHELTILGFHLKGNIWVDDKYDRVALEDDIGADLEIAMAARRLGLPGARTPVGILTRMRNTPADRIIKEIEASPETSPVDLGLLLLQIDGKALTALNRGITQLRTATRNDGKTHDLSVSFAGASSGLTIYCTLDNEAAIKPALRNHCEIRKYASRVDRWYGLIVRPDSDEVWFATTLHYPWMHSSAMDVSLELLPKTSRRETDQLGKRGVRKPGRNDPCPCGSGKKFKRCHGPD